MDLLVLGSVLLAAKLISEDTPPIRLAAMLLTCNWCFEWFPLNLQKKSYFAKPLAFQYREGVLSSRGSPGPARRRVALFY